jgi:hypothetical protein
VRLVFVLFALVHSVGCVYWYIGTVVEADEGFNGWTPPPHHRSLAVGQQWAYSIYWAIGLLTGVAPMTVVPATELEAYFTAVVLLLGVVMIALVVSSATSTLSNLDAAAESRRRELDAINGYLRFKRVPVELRQRVTGFYDYVWRSMQFMSFKTGDGEEGDTGARDDRDRDSILDPGARDETRRRSVGFRVDDVDT